MSENAHDKLLHDLAAGGINRAKIGGFDIDGVLRGRSCRPPGASRKDGSGLEARGGMMKAAMMGAVAFQKGLGACHSLAHPLFSEHGLHHGFANALCLPAVVDFVREAVPVRVARVAELLGASPDAAACAQALSGLRERIGLTGGLGGAGVPRGGLDKLAGLAFEDACHRSSARPATRADRLALYQASFA